MTSWPVTSPLRTLLPAEQDQVRVALQTALPTATAAHVLQAMETSPEAVAALPSAAQEHAMRAILAALPAGRSAVAVSKLGVGLKSDERYLEDVLTAQERADPGFRQRVETEARERGIPRWLAAVRLRDAGAGIDEVAERHRRRLRERPIAAVSSAAESPAENWLPILVLLLFVALFGWLLQRERRADVERHEQKAA